MLFHAWPFLLFFAIVYLVYLALSKTRFWIHWLLLSSYFFYVWWNPDDSGWYLFNGWWNPLYLLLIVYSTLLDYVVVRLMDRSRRRKLWLVISIANNLSLLGFFKYADFLTDNINALLTSLDVPYFVPRPPSGIALPVGISFYTFQSMSYTIDFYRGQIPLERNLFRFAAFVSLFPQLVAGPIERARELLPQLRRFPRITAADITDGMSLFVVGLFKKVALADYLGIYVHDVYVRPEQQNSPALLLATFAFAWQIYFDFSGYTDMARGVARVFGFRLMRNFNNPYLAVSLGDFWSRWHISLSSWFRDYVYIPLGGNRRGTLLTYRNLFLTMVISGVWHGAAWTFVIWGVIHALATMITWKAERSAWYRQKVPKFVKQLLVFLVVCFAWIFFRAANLDDAFVIIQRIVAGGWSDPRVPLLALILVGLVWTYQALYESRAKQLLELSMVRTAVVVFMILYLCTVPGTGNAAFIYFQF